MLFVALLSRHLADFWIPRDGFLSNFQWIRNKAAISYIGLLRTLVLVLSGRGSETR